ncbi:MAG: protein kinase [bacterium]
MLDTPSLVGTLIAGRYKLIERLGSGLSGDVYLAKHPVLGVRFAVKVLGEDFTDDEKAVTRLKHEAEVVGRINHPNIANTVDLGEMGHGLFYLVMEYVHGQSLGQELRRLDPELMGLKRSLSILKQLCHGLTTAHDSGVIHRAIKPSNILLTRSPSGEEQIKIIDFGLSKVMGEDGQSYVTRNRQILGSPVYMAPEQLTGAPVDRRADIYSVGVIAFQMLSGDLPFTGDTAIQIVAAQQHKPAPKLSLVRPADEAKVPSGLEKVFMQCLEIDREVRPRHISHITEAILMALPKVPDDEGGMRKSTITMVKGSQDEAALWSDASVNANDTAEIAIEDLEKIYSDHSVAPLPKLAQLSLEGKRNQVWNLINKKALELANLFQQYQLAPAELISYVATISALEEQEVAAETEIAVLKVQLDETDQQWRDRTSPLRDALLNLRVAHSRLMEDEEANAIILDTLDQQIVDLEGRLGHATSEIEQLQQQLDQQIEAVQGQLEVIQTHLGETQLYVLQLLRQCKQTNQPPDIVEGYAVLEKLIRHV